MDTGQTAWYLVAGIIVLFMTPGIAFFYGGLVKSKSVISMLMMSFGAMGIIGVLWVLYGFNMGTMAAGDGNLISGIAGNPFSDFGLGKMANSNESGFFAVFYGATFAMATVALISGAIADRARFVPWMIFAALWGTFNYFLVQGWVWSPGGWVFELGTSLGLDASTIDYAGGTAVHINSAAAALALAIVLGKRVGFAKGTDQAHNVPLTLIGVAILFAGWFGFNGGAAAFADNLEGLGLIIINTFAAATAGILGWVTVEHFKEGKSTSVGAGSGAIAGLVAITPACANLYPLWAIALGLLAGGLCAYAIEMKYKFGFDDSLDVVGIHGVGGFTGCWFLGFFATDTGLIYSGSADQLIVQVIASVGVALFSLTITFIIGYAIEKTIGFRVASDAELAGVDREIHGEDAYAFGM